MKVLTILAMVLLATVTTYGAGQDSILGLWKTEGGESKLEIFRCGEKVCVKIAWLKEPDYTDSSEGQVGTPKMDRNNPDPALKNRPMVGLQIMEGFTAAGDGRWDDGIIYNPENGKKYHGKLHLVSPERLELRGYLGISLLGRNYLLTR